MALTAAFVREAVTRPLQQFGFSRVGRRQVWMRTADGMHHAVSLAGSHRGSRWTVDWALVHPEVGWILHGKEAQLPDVAYSGFIRGRASSHHPPPGVSSGFTRDDVENRYEQTVSSVALAAGQVAGWTQEFSTVRGVIDRLLSAPGEDDHFDRRVIVPVSWTLRLFTAASLAAVESEPDALQLSERAVEAMQPWRGDLTDERIARLRKRLG